MDVAHPFSTAHNRRLAAALAVALVALAALAYALAALLDLTLNPDQSLDPPRSGFATGRGFAAAF